MTGIHYDIDRLASAAKIWLTDAGTEDVRRDMAPLIEMAESIADIAIPAGADNIYAIAGGVDQNAINGVSADGAAVDAYAADVAALREDIPSKEIETDIFYEQSPSAGGGFTIPRLLE